MWAGYNRRRAKDRAADAARSRERAAERLAAAVDAYQVPPPPKLSRKRHGFRVTVECLDDGARRMTMLHRHALPAICDDSTSARVKVAGRAQKAGKRAVAASPTPAAGLCLRGAGDGWQGERETV